MCLEKIDQKYKVHRYTGYQIMVKYPIDDIYYSYFNRSDNYIIGKWYNAKNKKIISNDFIQDKVDFKTYISGFHIFLNLKDCKNFCKYKGMIGSIKIVKVQFKKVTCKGYEFSPFPELAKVIVAQKRKILNEVNIKDI